MTEKKTYLITGCSTGIGYELALKLAAPNINLVLAARTTQPLLELSELCKKRGADILICKTDVSVEAECKNLVTETISRFQHIDILINNAGISMTANFDEIQNVEVFERLMRTNYLGVVYCTYYALESLKKRKGLIVGVSSLQGKTGFPRSSAYAASKFALQGFLDSIRIELSESGVDVLVVSPGPVATDIRNKKLNIHGEVAKDLKDYSNEKMMPADECAALIVRAIQKRQRELVMTSSGKILPWLKLISPGLVDKIILSKVNKFYS
ncbi:MAG: SDR family oxidoreductase [Bacteroidota bacterium]